MVSAVSAVLTVALVVFLVVADQVGQGKAVMSRDHVDRSRPLAGYKRVDITAARQAGGKGGPAALPPPVVANVVSEPVVPLPPGSRESAEAIAVGCRIPRFGDQLAVGQYGVLSEHREEGRHAAKLAAGPAAHQRRRQVEPEAVDVKRQSPIPQAVRDELQRGGVARGDGVTGSGGVQISTPSLIFRQIAVPVRQALERQNHPVVTGLSCVVEDDVDDHLKPRRVKGLDHLAELIDLFATVTSR